MNARPYTFSFDRSVGRPQMSYGMGDSAPLAPPAVAPPIVLLGDIFGGISNFDKWLSSWEGSGGTAIANAITPNPNPPTVTPGTGTPQLPSNYAPPIGQCVDASGNIAACDTSTPATPINYDMSAPATPDTTGSWILGLLAIAAVAGIFWMSGGRH